MLCNELVAVAEVVREIAVDTLGPCHQEVDEVVDDDGDVDAVDGFERHGLCQRDLSRTWSRAYARRPTSRKLGEGEHTTVLTLRPATFRGRRRPTPSP